MTASACKEELLSSIASLSPPLSFKSGTIELPHNPDPINLETFHISEPTLLDVQASSSNHTQPISCTP